MQVYNRLEKVVLENTNENIPEKPLYQLDSLIESIIKITNKIDS